MNLEKVNLEKVIWLCVWCGFLLVTIYIDIFLSIFIGLTLWCLWGQQFTLYMLSYAALYGLDIFLSHSIYFSLSLYLVVSVFHEMLGHFSIYQILITLHYVHYLSNIVYTAMWSMYYHRSVLHVIHFPSTQLCTRKVYWVNTR